MYDVIGFLEDLGQRAIAPSGAELDKALAAFPEVEQRALAGENTVALAQCLGVRQRLVCAVFAPEEAPAEDMPLSPDGDEPVEPALPESQAA